MAHAIELQNAIERHLRELTHGNLASIKKHATSIHTAELFFTAGKACPMDLVARSVYALAVPVLQILDIDPEDRGPGEECLRGIVSVVLGLCEETVTLRSQLQACKAELHELGGKERIELLEEDLGIARELLAAEKKETSAMAKSHLSTCEMLVKESSDAQSLIDQRAKDLSDTHARIAEMGDEVARLQRVNLRLTESLKQSGSMRDERFVDEVARGNVLRYQLAEAQKSAEAAKRQLQANNVLVSAVEAHNFTTVQALMSRGDLLHEMFAECWKLSLHDVFRDMTAKIMTLRAVMQTQEHNIDNYNAVTSSIGFNYAAAAGPQQASSPTLSRQSSGRWGMGPGYGATINNNNQLSSNALVLNTRTMTGGSGSTFPGSVAASSFYASPQATGMEEPSPSSTLFAASPIVYGINTPQQQQQQHSHGRARSRSGARGSRRGSVAAMAPLEQHRLSPPQQRQQLQIEAAAAAANSSSNNMKFTGSLAAFSSPQQQQQQSGGKGDEYSLWDF